jgi:hypothetical protein
MRLAHHHRLLLQALRRTHLGSQRLPHQLLARLRCSAINQTQQRSVHITQQQRGRQLLPVSDAHIRLLLHILCFCCCCSCCCGL